jgi:hypothetical protein
MALHVLFLGFLLLSCHSKPLENRFEEQQGFKKDPGTWEGFLQSLPVSPGPVLDYRGNQVRGQWKHTGILSYDVGTADLQQCADALMRLRAEYLFKAGRSREIGFHFTDGTFYRYSDYCNGIRVLASGNSIRLVKKDTSAPGHASLRKYLDIVYTYAGTISLARELKPASDFGIGVVVIHGGSPGHCFLITDERTGEKGEKWYKMVEGYTPAQTIYMLRNIEVEGNSPWHHLKKGPIETASYFFTDYELKRFE